MTTPAVGVDVVDVERVRPCCSSPAFLTATFTEVERAEAVETTDPPAYLAAAFAAKEAIFKSLRLASRELDAWSSIEIAGAMSPAPTVRLLGELASRGVTTHVEVLTHATYGPLIYCFAYSQRTTEQP